MSQPKVITCVGLMSGTSMDGIDAALLNTDGTNFVSNIGHISLEYPLEFKILLKVAERAVKNYAGNLDISNEHINEILSQYLTEVFQLNEEEKSNKISQLLNYLNQFLPIESQCVHQTQITLFRIIERSTYLHILAVQQLLEKYNYTSSSISLIGYHGQTLYHSPSNNISIIVGDCQLMSNTLNIQVIGNFRENDIKEGGQGAPFAPLYHYALTKNHNNNNNNNENNNMNNNIQNNNSLKSKYVAVVNCGGIANITLINNDNNNSINNISNEEQTYLNNNINEEIIAFDTGPGNGLLDRFVRLRTKGISQMDIDGRYGKEGKVNESIAQLLYEKSIIMKNEVSYYTQKPPKSLDINDMNLIEELNDLSLEDGCATLAYFTAYTIVKSLELISNNFFKLENKNNIIIEMKKKEEPVINIKFIDTSPKFGHGRFMTREEKSKLVSTLNAPPLNPNTRIDLNVVNNNNIQNSDMNSNINNNNNNTFHWILCGGGWYNPNIHEQLTKLLKFKYGNDKIIINTADEIGWNNQSIEAELFGYLAVRSLNNLPLSLPNTTGVKSPLSGGKCYSPQM